MSFQLSPDVDKNKIFLVNLSSCKTRIDPYYYKPEFSALRERLENHPSFQRVGSLIKSWNRGDGPRDGFYTDDAQTGVYFLRVNNLKNHTIDTNGIKHITRYVHENTLKRAQVTAGDVVFAISGTKDNLGTVSVIPRNILEANLNSALVKLELDWSAIDKRYFCYMFDLNITRVQIDFIGKGAAQNNLNNEEISQIHIFLPSISEQEKIVGYLDEAHFKKKKKEEEAQRSLDSIDDYLLSELGINLPEPEENTIQNRVFYRNLSEVSSGQFKPDNYRKERLEAIDSVKNGLFSVKRLRKVLIFRSMKANEIIEGTVYIGMENIMSNTGELVSNHEKDSISSASIFLKDDILFSKLRPYLNKVYYADGEGLCSTEFHVLYSNSECNEFIANFLRSRVIVAQTKYLMSGNTLPRLQSEDIEKLFIPIPPLEKQLEIVDRITAIRNQAKQLRQAAAAELERAKQEVEAMILG